jgi:hypothetical protein
MHAFLVADATAHNGPLLPRTAVFLGDAWMHYSSPCVDEHQLFITVC